MFGKHHWTPAQGTIVASHVVKTTGDGMVSRREYVVDVRTTQGEVFRAKVEEPRIATDFVPPSVGADVRVDFDAASHQVRFDKDDPSLSRKAMKKAMTRTDTFDQTLAQAPGTAPTSALAAGSMPSIEALLQSARGNVVKLDAQNPDTAALRDMLLRATGAPGEPLAADPATDDTQS